MTLYYYRAYGFTICSELIIPLLDTIEPVEAADIFVHYGNLDNISPGGSKGKTLFQKNTLGSVLVKNGNEIITDITDLPVSFLCPNYIGVILKQRCLHAFHGTALCKDGKATLIIGKSGSGKSSLASEFIEHGWKFMVDDVSILESIGESITIRSGVPVQKLCKDTVNLFNCSQQIIEPVPNLSKYYIDRSDVYFDEKSPVKNIVILKANELESCLRETNGYEKLSLLQPYLLNSDFEKEDWQHSIEFLIKIATMLPVFVLNRNSSMSLYEEYVILNKTCHSQ